MFGAKALFLWMEEDALKKHIKYVLLIVSGGVMKNEDDIFVC